MRIGVFEVQHTARTNLRANATAHAGGPHDVLPFLGVGTDVDAHFAIGGAVAAGNALSAVGGYAEARLEPLHQTQVCRQRAAEAAPDAVTHERVEAHANDPRE